MDRLTAMAAFVRVVEKGGFTSAAEDLRLSRAMVSKHARLCRIFAVRRQAARKDHP
jgi:DNA-binding transcriptional LysR family regulator